MVLCQISCENFIVISLQADWTRRCLDARFLFCLYLSIIWKLTLLLCPSVHLAAGTLIQLWFLTFCAFIGWCCYMVVLVWCSGSWSRSTQLFYVRTSWRWNGHLG